MEIDTNKLEIQDVIECPLCKKSKFMSYKGTTGAVSFYCNSCKHLIYIDWNKKEACVVKPKKNAYKQLKK